MTDPRICKHPLIHLVTNDIRYYCPDCGKYIYDHICGVDPVSENDSVSILKVHPDGTLENMTYSGKFTREELDKTIDEVWKGCVDVPGHFNDGKGFEVFYSPELWEETWKDLEKRTSVPKKYLGKD